MCDSASGLFAFLRNIASPLLFVSNRKLKHHIELELRRCFKNERAIPTFEMLRKKEEEASLVFSP